VTKKPTLTPEQAEAASVLDRKRLIEAEEAKFIKQIEDEEERAARHNKDVEVAVAESEGMVKKVKNKKKELGKEADDEGLAMKAMLESLISSMITYRRAITGVDLEKTDPDTREYVRALIVDCANHIKTDDSCWPQVKHRFLYDVYLAMREDSRQATSFDYIRPGLMISDFSDKEEYYKHRIRISNKQKEDADGRTKICAVCGEVKPESKFKFRGGATCNSCRGKAYRKRASESGK